MKWVPLLVALALGTTVLAAPPAQAGPCDNEVERLLCALLEPIDVAWVFESVRHLCDHWLNGCEVPPALP